MAFVAASSQTMPADTRQSIGSRARRGGPDTAQYGWVWPNDEIRARDYEGARSGRDGRGRSRPHCGGRWPHRRDRTSTGAATDAGLSGQLDASLPAGSQGRMIAGSSRQPATRATSGSMRRACRSRTPDEQLALSSTGSRARPQALCQRPLPSSKGQSRPARLLVVRGGALAAPAGTLARGDERDGKRCRHRRRCDRNPSRQR